MKKLSFISLYVLRLTIGNVLGLVTTTIDLAVAVKDSLSDMAKTILNQLIADKEKFEPMVNYPRRSELTLQIKALNTDRKNRLAEIKRIVKLNLKGRDEAKKKAAQTLNFFFEKSWDIVNDPQNSASGLISALMQNYRADAGLAAAAAVIGVDGFLTEFENCNTQFDTLFKQRLAEDAAHELSATNQMSTVCNSYNEFCTVIEQAANFSPNNDILTLFKNMDELRKNYRGLLPKGKGPAEPDPVK
jgi:hypothetical protein